MSGRMKVLLATLAAVTAAATPACWESGGCHIVTHCDGDDLHACAGDAESGMSEVTTDCTTDGRVCRQSGATVACVFADRPCTRDACAGDRIARCSQLGLVESDFDCTSDEPGRSCFDGAAGPLCGYPTISCPAPGTDTLCGADAVSLYSGCAGQAHPRHREDCGTSYGDVCTTANGGAGCADPAFIPCAKNTYFCSADLTHAYACGDIGLVWQDDDCAARGQTCQAGWCTHGSPTTVAP
jgi:hypothetical protein